MLKARISGISQYSFTKSAEQHLTVMMLDLSDPVRFDMAKSLLQSLEREIQQEILGAVGGADPEPVSLKFKGIGTFAPNPKQSRVMFLKVAEDNSFAKLQKIAHLIISAFIDKGVTS